MSVCLSLRRSLLVLRSLASRESDTGYCFRAHEIHTFVAEREFAAGSVEESLAVARQDRYDRKVQLVDQSGPKILSSSGRSTADASVQAIRGFQCPFKR